MILESFQSKGLTVSHGISEDCTIQMYAVTPYLVALEERVESILKIHGIAYLTAGHSNTYFPHLLRLREYSLRARTTTSATLRRFWNP